jgi:hypothetical protein
VRTYVHSPLPLSRLVAVVFIFTIIFTAVPVRAQDAISGRVLDATGRPIARVKLALMDSSGKVQSTTFSGSDGQFRFVGANTAGCRVEASLAGF